MAATKKTPKTPRLDLPLTQNPAEAEAGVANIYFEWRGVEIAIDPTTVQFGAWAFAIRRVTNLNLPLLDRINAAIDVFEATIGQEQLTGLLAVCPDLFDNTVALTEFWEGFITAVNGATPGEF